VHDGVGVVVDLDGWRLGAVDADNAAFKLVVGVGGRVGDVPPGAMLESGDLPDFIEGCVGRKSEEYMSWSWSSWATGRVPQPNKESGEDILLVILQILMVLREWN